MFNLKHLHYLNAVYQYKNFTQAADALFVSQPTISTAINTLETDMDVKLIERSSKNVTFTPEGEQFMFYVRRILSLCAETENTMRDLSDSAQHRLKLGMSYAFMDAMAPVLFSDFLKHFPGSKIHLDEGSMNRHIDMVENNQLDLAYNGFPDGNDYPELEFIPVSRAEIRLVLHPESYLCKLERIPIELLKKEQIVMMDERSKVKQMMEVEFEKRDIHIETMLNYTQILCMTSLVRTCRYVGIISQAAGHSIPGVEGLELRSFKKPLYFDLGFFRKKDRYLPKLGWELIKYIKEVEGAAN